MMFQKGVTLHMKSCVKVRKKGIETRFAYECIVHVKKERKKRITQKKQKKILHIRAYNLTVKITRWKVVGLTT